MKQLQNNFTTPEQSQRLLELGIPADSADCYYVRMKHDEFETPRVSYEQYSKLILFHPKTFIYLPCWSVGRLIEIYNICVNFMPGMQLDLENEPESCTYIELIVSSFELAADDGLTYFSKLYE